MRAARAFANNCRGVAATEFAILLPVMLALFFGTIELCEGIAIFKKVGDAASSVSQMTVQSISVADADLASFIAAASVVMLPYDLAPLQVTVSGIAVDAEGNATVQWSSGSAPHALGAYDLAAGLASPSTYLVLGETSYVYTPTLGWFVSPFGITLTGSNHRRPLLASCVAHAPALNCP